MKRLTVNLGAFIDTYKDAIARVPGAAQLWGRVSSAWTSGKVRASRIIEKAAKEGNDHTQGETTPTKR